MHSGSKAGAYSNYNVTKNCGTLGFNLYRNDLLVTNAHLCCCLGGEVDMTLCSDNALGELELCTGLCVNKLAKRHIHLTPEAAAEMGVADKEIVCVKIASDSERTTIFGDVVVRVSEKFAPAMHIDTDESNAAFNAAGPVYGEIVK